MIIITICQANRLLYYSPIPNTPSLFLKCEHFTDDDDDDNDVNLNAHFTVYLSFVFLDTSHPFLQGLLARKVYVRCGCKVAKGKEQMILYMILQIFT